MKASIRVFTQAKRGELEADNMDACWPGGDGEADRPVVRLAMADGATEHLLSGRWAAQVVRRLSRSPVRDVASPERFARNIGVPGAGWVRSLAAYQQMREEQGEPLHWYEFSKLLEGSAVTVLALFLQDGEGTATRGTWHAAAIGDTNLFHSHVHGDQRTTAAFPLRHQADFTDTPPLLLSEVFAEEEIRPRVRCMSGEWASGDVFLLATDALAAWICGAFEAGGDPWTELDGATAGPEAFASWLAGKRNEREMRNDDVTLLRLAIH
ncbi:hypothetical protein [Actinomadura rugatobispora]|uniref:Protein phosphatase 2C domain-containing protein n=1 Tax=Actinomadura rugatobispora TaxID=1994 RepID=A0ABW1AAX9_9ACTN|nr:hypothetical protein GCM10010200_079350 [Actinomadura rugatobispora]